MENYKVIIKAAAEKDFDNLHATVVSRIGDKIGALAENPFPAASKKLKGAELYRLRVGDYRVVYAVDSANFVIEVKRVGHRGDVYRNL